MALKAKMMTYEKVHHDSCPRYNEDNEWAIVGKEEEEGSHCANVAKGKKASNKNPTGRVDKATSSNTPKGIRIPMQL
ncbi:hypothetical protein GH714_009320 [Hevea brasiliensis]|uniref:Uncharacterized protein n=1 Tax=Hevea brasiliensis TaxID=3981 RepID=A0A6A6KU45_HEVBR|nr:hypothetical protein GH714_009320 [Hevea brasiliensis]